MKKNILTLTAATFGVLIIGILVFSIYSPSLAQKKFENHWEYAAVTFTNVPFSSDNQPIITAVANICFLQINGCQNEEVKAELPYSRFLQDFRLENSNDSKILAYDRARELAFTKAVAKLGLEGWEITGQPSINFDTYILNNQGNYTISKGNKEIKPNVFFKRKIQ